jgi:hypothetical protein
MDTCSESSYCCLADTVQCLSRLFVVVRLRLALCSQTLCIRGERCGVNDCVSPMCATVSCSPAGWIQLLCCSSKVPRVKTDYEGSLKAWTQAQLAQVWPSSFPSSNWACVLLAAHDPPAALGHVDALCCGPLQCCSCPTCCTSIVEVMTM